jgi:heptosyltransferase-2
MVAFYSALSGDTQGLEQDRPRLHVPDAAIDAAVQAQAVAHGAYLVFAPGAEFGPSKRWPEAHYAQLAAGQALPVLLLGSGKDAPVCDAIVQGSTGRARNLAGRTSLAEAFALIAGARAMVSNDSGLMHVAAAFGVPQVALFGSSSPLHTPPLNERACILWLKQDPDYLPPLDCAPCFERECPLGHHRCLNDMAPARVAAALQSASNA